MNQEKMGQLIAELRKERNLTQDELGEKFCVNGKAVSKWECGRSIPDISIIIEIANYFNLSVDDLLKGKKKVKVDDLSAFQKTLLWLKNHFVFVIIEIFLMFILIFLSLFFVSNYNKYNVFDIKSVDSEFSISGKIFSTVDTQYIILDNISYQTENAGTSNEQLVSSFSFYLKSEDDILLNYSSPEIFDDDGNVKFYYFSDIFSNITILTNELEKSDKVKNFKNIVCEVIYIDNFGIEKKELIKFNVVSAD